MICKTVLKLVCTVIISSELYCGEILRNLDNMKNKITEYQTVPMGLFHAVRRNVV